MDAYIGALADACVSSSNPARTRTQWLAQTLMDVSHVTIHTSHITCHTSHITHHPSPAGACDAAGIAATTSARLKQSIHSMVITRCVCSGVYLRKMLHKNTAASTSRARTAAAQFGGSRYRAQMLPRSCRTLTVPSTSGRLRARRTGCAAAARCRCSSKPRFCR